MVYKLDACMLDLVEYHNQPRLAGHTSQKANDNSASAVTLDTAAPPAVNIEATTEAADLRQRDEEGEEPMTFPKRKAAVQGMIASVRRSIEDFR